MIVVYRLDFQKQNDYQIVLRNLFANLLLFNNTPHERAPVTNLIKKYK